MKNEQFASSTVDDCRLFTLDKHHHENGNLSVAENGPDFPFRIKRVFFIYDVPGGTDRGNHCHFSCHEFVVAASGSFDFLIDDGREKRVVTLNRSNVGLHIVPGIWVELRNFSSGSVCLTMVSETFDPDDYVHGYDEFLKLKER